MNDFTKENISIAFSNAIANENLMHKDIAEIFQTESYYLSCMKNGKYWSRVPKVLWDRLQVWMYSGKKIKGYILPEIIKAGEETKSTDEDFAKVAPEQLELKEILNKAGTSIVESVEKPIIKVKPEVLEERKKVIGEREKKKRVTKTKERWDEIREEFSKFLPLNKDIKIKAVYRELADKFKCSVSHIRHVLAFVEKKREEKEEIDPERPSQTNISQIQEMKEKYKVSSLVKELLYRKQCITEELEAIEIVLECHLSP